MAQTLDSVGGLLGNLRGQITLTNSGKELKPPKTIVTTVASARAIYLTYRSEHLKRIQLYAQIEGLIAGNPPYDPIELEQNGLSYLANFNNLDGRALYDRGALAYWNLFNQTEHLFKFELLGDDPELLDHAETMAHHFDYVIRCWPAFYTMVNTLTGQLIKFGISPIIWPDERDWRWRTIELSKFYVADQALTDVTRLTVAAVESIFTAQYLFEVYEAIKDLPPEKTSWNKNELERLLLYRANSWAKQDTQIIDFMDLQKRLQNGDIGYNVVFSDSIRLVSLLYQEYDGRISHYMFDRTFDAGNFLFKSLNQYKSLEEALLIFTASPGEFTIHSNRGLGHKIFAGCQAMMQLDCSLVDMARMSTTPLIKSISTGSKDFEVIRFYPGVPTNIGTAEFVENQLGANISQVVSASQYILAKLNYNTSNSGDDPSTPDRNTGSISDSQARRMSFKEFGVLKHNIAHFYSQFDLVGRNMAAKLLKSKKGYPGYAAAKEWKDRCIADGVPPELFASGDEDYWGLPRHLKVRASRVAGDGSTLALITGLESLLPISGGFGPKAAKEYNRQWIMATLGTEYIPAFTSDSDDPDETSGGASLAAVENAVMRFGESPVFSMDNEQRAHFSTHLALGENVIQRIQQQQTDPIQADKIFTVLIPHMQQHLKALSQSPFAREYLQGVLKPWGQLEQYAILNRKNAARMMQAQIDQQQKQADQTQKVLSDEQLKELKTKSDIDRRNRESDSKIAIHQEQSDAKAGLNRESVAHKASVDRLKVTLDAQNSNNAGQSLDQNRADLQDLNGATPAPYDIESNQ